MVEHKAGDVVKMLRELHYEEIRISGDHHMFRGPKGNLIPVAYSSRKTLIPVGTYKHILHQVEEHRQLIAKGAKNYLDVFYLLYTYKGVLFKRNKGMFRECNYGKVQKECSCLSCYSR